MIVFLYTLIFTIVLFQMTFRKQQKLQTVMHLLSDNNHRFQTQVLSLESENQILKVEIARLGQEMQELLSQSQKRVHWAKLEDDLIERNRVLRAENKNLNAKLANRQDYIGELEKALQAWRSNALHSREILQNLEDQFLSLESIVVVGRPGLSSTNTVQEPIPLQGQSYKTFRDPRDKIKAQANQDIHSFMTWIYKNYPPPQSTPSVPCNVCKLDIEDAIGRYEVGNLEHLASQTSGLYSEIIRILRSKME